MGIWDQLNTKTIGDKPSVDIQKQSNPVHLQDQNRQELIDIKLINDATFRSSSDIIPDSGNLDTQTITDNGYSNRVVIMSPEKGEVLRVIGLAATTSGSPSSSIGYFFFLQDQTVDNTSSNAAIYLDSQSSGSSNVPFLGVSTFLNTSQYELAYPFQLTAYVDNLQGTSSIDIKTATVRVK